MQTPTYFRTKSEGIMMLVNLDNFDETIEERIVERGYEYYHSDTIATFQNLGDKEFSAVVWGSSEYSVFIKLGYKNTVIEHSCDCPYDWGDFCKHEVAVLYYIKFNEEHLRDGKPSKSLLDIQKELKNYNKPELINFVMNLAKRDRNLQNTMLRDLGLRG